MNGPEALFLAHPTPSVSPLDLESPSLSELPFCRNFYGIKIKNHAIFLSGGIDE